MYYRNGKAHFYPITRLCLLLLQVKIDPSGFPKWPCPKG